MKIYFLLILLTLNGVIALGQTSKKPVPGVPVKVTNWQERVLMINDSVMEQIKDSITSIIGEAEYEKFKANSTAFKWPTAIGGKMWRRADSLLRREHNEKLGRLHVYQIASYQHVWEGVTRIKYAILRVPYKGNEDWDKEVKWDTIYFMVDEKCVQVL